MNINTTLCYPVDSSDPEIQADIRLFAAMESHAELLAAIPEGCTIDRDRTIRRRGIELAYQGELSEALMAWLDEQGAPRTTAEGEPLSVNRRVPLFLERRIAEAKASAEVASVPRVGGNTKPESTNWAALGYVKGATVEQDCGTLAGKQRAVIACVHTNGALDVVADGVAYGWSARHCKPVAADSTASRAMLPATDWKIDGGLIYRLNDEGVNCDEINVTMANGSRSNESRNAAAQSILVALASPVAGWVSVEERLPEIGQEVIVWCGFRTFGQRSDDQHDPENHSGWVVDIDNGMAGAITHWQDAPPAPVVTPQEQS